MSPARRVGHLRPTAPLSGMLEQTLAIIRNTFFESIRQPIVLVLLGVATLMLVTANFTATFTMADDQKMLIDVGMATVFVFGALLAAFIATSVLTREIENKTVLTVVSKPVGRPLFVIGKFLGVALAILVASLYMCFVFALIEHHGVLQTVRDPTHKPVVTFGLAALLISVGVSVWCNYFYGKVFASTMICTATPLAALAYFFSLLFDPDFKSASLVESFNTNLWIALVCLIIASMVLTAIALAISTRLSQLMTILVTIGVFLLGMLSDWLFGHLMFQPAREAALNRAKEAGEVAAVEVYQPIVKTTGEVMNATHEVTVVVNSAYQNLDEADFNAIREGTRTLRESGLQVADASVVWDHLSGSAEHVTWLLGRIGHSIFPNFQVLWLSDAVTQEHVIPGSYLLKVSLYGLTSIVAAISLAVILFQRREVG